MPCLESYWHWEVVLGFGSHRKGDQLVLGRTQGSNVHGQSISPLEVVRQTEWGDSPPPVCPFVTLHLLGLL